MSLKELLKRVRIEGKTKINKNLPLEKNLPIVITEDCNGNLTYLNSGGRSIIFEYGDSTYRLKGVDPNGILTKKVALSQKNKISDVRGTYFIHKEIEKTWPPKKILIGKPFGVLTEEDATREKIVVETLNENYKKLGFEPPYEYVGTYKLNDGTFKISIKFLL